LSFDSKIYFDFDLTGSERVTLSPGVNRFAIDYAKPGWHLADIIGSDMWVRGLPVYMSGGDRVTFDIGENYVRVDGRVCFVAATTRSVQYSYDPTINLRCNDCTIMPTVIIDGSTLNYTFPQFAFKSGWHSIEIRDSHDNVDIYYSRTFSNYTVTEIAIYPVETH